MSREKSKGGGVVRWGGGEGNETPLVSLERAVKLFGISNMVNVEYYSHYFVFVGPFERTRTIFRIAGTTERL